MNEGKYAVFTLSEDGEVRSHGVVDEEEMYEQLNQDVFAIKLTKNNREQMKTVTNRRNYSYDLEEAIKENVQMIDDIVNSFMPSEQEETGRQVAKLHPTLQQSFMRLVLAFLNQIANNPADARNAASVELAMAMLEAAQQVKSPSGATYYYEARDRFDLPFV